MLPELFEAQTRRTPAETAVIADTGPLSYDTLNRAANRLARLLIQRAVAPEHVVALVLPRSVDIVIAQLAVLKAGAAYLPVDPGYPAERIAFMLADTRPAIVIGRTDLADRLSDISATATLLLVDDPATGALVDALPDDDVTDVDRVAPLRPGNPAYLIYTSGSTGVPKGVTVTHAGLANFAAAEIEHFEVRPGDRVLQFSSPSFDASVLELCMSLPAGASIVVPPPGPLLGEQLADVLAGRRVTHALIPPPALATVPAVPLPDFRTLIVGGDACPAHLVARWAPGRRMINAYGPTENTVVSSWSPPLLPSADAPPIGHAMPGVTCHVLDDALRPAESGELYVTGVGLARGYQHRPGLTAQRFVADPYGRPGSRMYRTGDLVRGRADGQLEFLGRADHQVKIRGFRIEPGEIETRLRRHPEVAEAVVVARETDQGHKRLVAYVVPAADVQPDTAELRALVRESLPGHMMPSSFVTLDALPLSPNGKLDRTALPEPVVDDVADSGHVPPVNDAQRLLAQIWAEVLGVARVGIRDDFFALGGDSIMAAKVLSRLAARSGIRLPVRAVFDEPTVERFAALLPTDPAGRRAEPIPRLRRDAALPLSSAQQRLWFLNELTPGSTEYNTGVALRLSGPLDVDALRAALSELVDRHDSLRTTFDTVAGRGVQLVAGHGELPLDILDLSTTDVEDRERELSDALNAQLRTAFDLVRGPLSRALLVRLAGDDHVLMLCQHHIVTDGTSIRILVDELVDSYPAGPTTPSRPAIDYPDFAAWERDRLADPDIDTRVDYWKRQLAGLRTLALPTDRARPANRTTAGAVFRRGLDADLVGRATIVGRAHGATPFMTLTAALAVLLSQYSGQDDIAVGTVTAGRSTPELERLVGMLVNTVVLRTQVTSERPFADFLGDVRETVLAAFTHEVPFDRLVDEVKPERDLSRTPLVQAMVVLHDVIVPPRRVGELRIAEHDLPRPAARFDLVVEFWPKHDSLELVVEYNTDLFDPDTIDKLAAHLELLLRTVIADPDRPIGGLPMPAGSAAAPRERPVAVRARTDAELKTRYVAPRTPTEATLARVFAAVLGLGTVGVRDNFFSLGGDSILVIQVVSLARQAGLGLTSKDVFQHQTIASLATVATASAPAHVDQGPVSGAVPLTPIQRWFLDGDQARPEYFHQSLVLEVTGNVAESALRGALDAVVAHHDALRMRFRRTTDGWSGHNAAAEPGRLLSRYQLSAADDQGQRSELDKITDELNAGFDLATGPLLKAALVERGGDRPPLLVLVAHHLVVDGVSWRILLADLDDAYRRIARGDAVEFDAKTTSFRDWAVRLSSRATAGDFDAELDHWIGTARDHDPTLPRSGNGANTVASTRSVTVRLDQAETAALLRDVPAVYRTQVNDVLLAALGRVLTGWTGRTTVPIDLEGHGREEFDGVDLSRTVGWFTTIHPVALNVPGDDWGVVLKSVKEQLRATPGKGLGYGALRHLACHPALDDGRTPWVSFNYLGQFQPVTDGGLYRSTYRELSLDAAPEADRAHVLDVVGMVAGGRLEFTWFYSAHLHREPTITGLAEDMLAALRAIIGHCAAAGTGGRTPSDFPLARLTQAAVDRLVGHGRDVVDVCPLTPMQAGMVFHALSQADEGVYVQQVSFVLDGVDDPRALGAAWQDVVDRTPILRSTVAWDGLAEPVQVVHADVTLPVSQHDWSTLSETVRDQRLRQLLAEDSAAGLALDTAPLMRVAIARLSPASVRVVWTFHHVLLDGWSTFGVLSDVLDAYAEPTATRPERPAFRDYLAWLRSQDEQRAERFWRPVLSGFPAPTPLPYDRPPTSSHASQTSERVTMALDAQTSSRLYEFAKRHQLTLNAVVQGAWALLLSRYSGQRDVCFGATVSGRPAELPGVRDMIGIFINTLPVRVRVSDATPVGEWLRQLQQTQVEARQFEHVALTRLRAYSDVPGETNLFDSVVVFENYPINERFRAGGGVCLRDMRAVETTNYPLSATVYPEHRLSVVIGYDPAAFEHDTVARLADHLDVLLTAIISDPDQRVSELEMLTPEERQRVLVEWNDTDRVSSMDTMVKRFAEQVERTPEATAVVSGSVSLTYGQLDRRANQVAHRLVSLGVRPEARVGVLAGRSIEQIVAVLAVVKIGAAYVPLDVRAPAARLSMILVNAGVELLLTDREWAATAAEVHDGGLVVIDDPVTDDEPDHRPAVPVRPDNAAYVIHTSGSTGLPKGVVARHRDVVALATDRCFSDGAHARVLLHSPLAFDASTYELWVPLLNGGQIVVAPPGEVTGETLRQQITAHAVTSMWLTAGLFRAIGLDTPDCFTGLHEIWTGGDVVPATAVRAVRAACPSIVVVDGFGPTETTTFATHHRIPAHATVPDILPIGRPLDNMRVYVLDATLRPVPPRAPGELYIAGHGLARGYHNRPGLTAQRFIANPHGQPGDRMYRTGDVVRWTTNGELEFLGRADDQVKLRGFRIEPGEIERQLTDHPDVGQALVVAAEHRPGVRRLVGYVVPADGSSGPDLVALRDFLGQRLPDYMVPEAFLALDAFPLTPNGKIDRAALPEPESSGVDAVDYVAPRTDTELRLAEIWAEVLRAEQVGVHDSFFALGGDSIQSLHVVSRTNAAFDVTLTPRDVMTTRTVSLLAELVEEKVLRELELLAFGSGTDQQRQGENQ